MKVLVTGATGFIGRHVAACLIAAGHEVLIGARDGQRADRIFPDQRFIACDFTRDLSSDDWRPRLQGVEALVNCVGVLQPRRRATMEAVHLTATAALFDACAASGVRRVIHVSALGVETGIDLHYATSKLAADAHLQGLDLEWTILRPSLVYTPAGSYGGTSLLRAQAALPLFVPLPGKGEQPFQPVFMDDLTEGIRRLLEDGVGIGEIIPVTGPEPIAIREVLFRLRRWLGLGRAWALRIPMPVMRLLARLGDLVGGGPLTTTSLRMIEQGNAAAPDRFTLVTGIVPRGFDEVLAQHPAQVQDRWHARLYVLRPALRTVLGLYWIVGASVMLFGGGLHVGRALSGGDAAPGGGFDPWQIVFGLALASGLLLLLRWKVRLVLAWQLWVLAIALLWWAASLVGLMVAIGWQLVWPNLMLFLGFALILLATLVAWALEDDK
ncbi:MAG: complex I NDUFA9 subunit family protein [Kiloniellales bacterium]|nr:complex I NDUFA9 subunit family protein [Kiloniellales bacterium]